MDRWNNEKSNGKWKSMKIAFYFSSFLISQTYTLCYVILALVFISWEFLNVTDIRSCFHAKFSWLCITFSDLCMQTGKFKFSPYLYFYLLQSCYPFKVHFWVFLSQFLAVNYWNWNFHHTKTTIFIMLVYIKALWYSALWFGSVKYIIVWCNTVNCNAMQCSSVLHVSALLEPPWFD